MFLTTLKGQVPVKQNGSSYRVKWESQSASKIQTQVKTFLKQYWQFHEVYEEFVIKGSKLRLDLLNMTLRIAVETSGEQHFKFTPFFHKTRSGFGSSIKRDDAKFQWLERNSIKLIEIRAADLPLLSKEYILEKFGVEIT